MKKVFLSVFCMWMITASFAQTVSQKLQKAFQQFETDIQLKHAISSLYVIDAKTGQVIFDKNSQVGLAPASTQKIITSVTAFELLGKDYQYKTEFSYSPDYDVKGESHITIAPSGDPTFGSWRWATTSSKNIFDNIIGKLKTIKADPCNSIGLSNIWNSEIIPDGWIWQDVGNYYGAGAETLNWRENQYDLILKSGNSIGDSVSIVRTEPFLYYQKITSHATSGAKGSGDNAYIYMPLNNRNCIIRGTIPIEEDQFKISGSINRPGAQFLQTLEDSIKNRNMWATKSKKVEDPLVLGNSTVFYSHYSPSLDSIIYWFLKKSINLYGEALIKTFAYEKQGFGSTDSGVAIVKKFWKQKGLGEDELNMYDGSGLSPLNRVTTHSQVEILKYAKTKDWFQYFYNALPDYNGMKMKSGTISDVKGFCGYHKSKDGREYIFSFLVNNYSGKTSGVVGKMYKVLDELK